MLSICCIQNSRTALKNYKKNISHLKDFASIYRMYWPIRSGLRIHEECNCNVFSQFNSAMTCHGTCLINLYCTSVHFKLKTHYWSSFIANFVVFIRWTTNGKYRLVCNSLQLGLWFSSLILKCDPSYERLWKLPGSTSHRLFLFAVQGGSTVL